MTKNLSQSGQVILILLLVITIGLGVGLSVIQRSISNVSTSTKVEESSRAFSAAEAGIEQAIVQISQGGLPQGVDFTSQNQSKAVIDSSGSVPVPHQIFELEPIAKEGVVQAWLADPNKAPDASSLYYDSSAIDIYWGNANVIGDPAIEVSLIYLQNNEIKRQAYYFDPSSARASSSGFCFSDPCPSPHPPSSFVGCLDYKIDTSFGTNREFACKATISSLSATDLGVGRILLLVRARPFYTSGSNPIAFGPTGGNCGQPCSFPPQATVIVSTGTSGQTQRRIQLFRRENFVPWYFDYAIFSLAAINK